MRKLPIVLGLALTLVVSGGAFASFFDNFDSYATGPLSTVSGGVWRTWGGNSTDAQVVTGGLSPPNAQMHNGIGTPDVVTYWDSIMQSNLGHWARVSFDFLVHETPNTDPALNDIEGDVTFTSGDPLLNDIDYGTGLGILRINTGPVSPGYTCVRWWDLDGLNGGGEVPFDALVADQLALDVWHHVDVIATLTVADPLANDPLLADGTFDVFVDGALGLSATFGWENPRGWNATEIWSYADADPIDEDYFLVDNFEAVPVPEPSSLLALGGFLPALALLRRRK